MPAANKYQKLFTPEDSVVVFIDHQPQMTFGVNNIDKALLMNNVSSLMEKEVVQEISLYESMLSSQHSSNPLPLYLPASGNALCEDRQAIQRPRRLDGGRDGEFLGLHLAAALGHL